MKNLIYITISFLIFFSCKVQKSCPGFGTNDISQFSYKKSDTITFENESSDLFQIYISDIILSLPYAYECQDLYKICPCLNYIEALATDTKTLKTYTFLRMEQSDVSEMQYFKYNIQGFKFDFDFINELPHINQMAHLKYYSSLSIGTKVYQDVIAITNLDSEKNDILQVFFNKHYGVLRFIEKSTNNVWSLKN